MNITVKNLKIKSKFEYLKVSIECKCLINLNRLTKKDVKS